MSEPDETPGPPSEFQEEIDAFVEGAAGLFDSLKDIFAKSKEEIVRGAQQGKVRIDVYQLRKDREHFLQRLGEEVYARMVAGDIDHDSLRPSFEKIQALDTQIAQSEEEIDRLEAESSSARAEAGMTDEPAESAPEAAVEAEPAPAKKAPKKAAKKPAAKKSTGKKASGSKGKGAAGSKTD